MVFIGKPPDIWEHYVKHAEFIDDRGLKNNGTEVYVIISNGFALKYSIIAFRSDPIGYARFTPGLHYEHNTDVLFIGGGTVIKTYRLSGDQMIFEKDDGLGFWGWTKHSNVVIQQAETDIRIFNLSGEQVWEAYVSPPYDLAFFGDRIELKFDDVVETRDLMTGFKV